MLKIIRLFCFMKLALIILNTSAHACDTTGEEEYPYTSVSPLVSPRIDDYPCKPGDADSYSHGCGRVTNWTTLCCDCEQPWMVDATIVGSSVLGATGIVVGGEFGLIGGSILTCLAAPFLIPTALRCIGNSYYAGAKCFDKNEITEEFEKGYKKGFKDSELREAIDERRCIKCTFRSESVPQ